VTFIVSTHDMTLIDEQSTNKILLVRDCVYQNSKAVSRDVDLINSPNELPENSIVDILGARRNLLFVEGEKNSLDLYLYAILFPQFSVIAKKQL
jgi:hypothetical protein